jgi:LysR family positive regulator for ilvC
MDLRTLELFVALADNLHFGSTSKAMHVSPSALSRHIQRLEDALGVRLFIRNNRSVELTQQGQQALLVCQNLIASWQQLQQQFGDDSELSGRLRLYCSVTAAQTLMRQFIERFRPLFPRVALLVETGDAALSIDNVLQQYSDIAIAPRPDKVPEGLLMCELNTSPLVFIRPRAECEVRLQTLSKKVDWSMVPMIVARMGLSRDRLFTWFAQHQQRPRVYAEVAGHEAIVAMVGLGLGIGLVPEVVLEQSLVREQIEVFERPNDIPPYHVSVCCLERSLQDPVIAAFWHLAVNGT